MVETLKLKEVIIEAGVRIFKALGMGGAITTKECAPFGLDASPVKDMIAIYSKSTKASQRYIIGYINKNQLAEQGETRLFSVDSNGVLQSYIWNKANGDLELNGSDYSAARYQPLNTGLQNQVNLINQNLTAIQAAITGLGGAYVPINVSIDISTAESQKVRIK